MRLVSFNVFRTLGLPNVSQIKPEQFLARPSHYFDQLRHADWVLFPEYWQLNSLLYGVGCRIFPNEATYRIGHDKIETTRLCQACCPHHIPYTVIAANTPEEAHRIWLTMATPFVAKLPKASQGEGVWLIETPQDWRTYLARTDRIYVQEYLPIEKDLRVVLVGTEILTAYWRHQSDRSFHTNIAKGGQVSYDDIPEQAIALVTHLANRFGINHAGFDVAMVGDKAYLIEINRLFGNRGIPGGGAAITDAMLRYISQFGDGHRPVNPQGPGPLPLAI